MNRRSFVKNAALLCTAAQISTGSTFASGPPIAKKPAAAEDINATRIPRWRGFNLQGKFSMPQRPYDGACVR